MKKVVFGFLGTKLDSGVTEKRWTKWRPTVSIAADEEFVPDVFELFLTNPEHKALADVVVADVQKLQPLCKVNVHHLEIEDPWNFVQVYAALHDFARTYDFQGCDVFTHITTGTHVAQICMFLLTESRYFPGKILETRFHGTDSEADWKGGLDIIDLDLSRYDLLAKRNEMERRDSQDLLKGGIKTRNAAFNTLIVQVERVALRSTAPMLLCGPTGAGKSHLAKRVYELRARRHLVKGDFVEVNCATLRGDNAMSALFGHKKGAFTGAASERPGLLKAANKGILFMDEIGELGLDEQAMLLRALEDKRFLPLGSDKEVESDFQLLTGTNRNLEAMVNEGTFRADLLARINLWTFELPGLAQRIEDLEPNLDFELEEAARVLGGRVSMNTEARKQYLQVGLRHTWPGNFRDLSASVARMATLAEGGRISVDDVQHEVTRLGRRGAKPEEVVLYPLCLRAMGAARVGEIDDFDLVQVECMLKAVYASSNMAEAGRLLFAKSRQAKKSSNDSDRMRKSLAKWDLEYTAVKSLLAAA